MILIICKQCGKHITKGDFIKKDNIFDINICPCCNGSLKDSEKYKFSNLELLLEDIHISNMIKERNLKDNGMRFTLEEVKLKRNLKKRE